MRDADQAVRLANSIDPVQLESINSANTATLKSLIAACGLPTRELVGKDGHDAAFLVLLHSTQDPSFQAELLPFFEREALNRPDARKRIAYLWDRLHDPQKYGTQGRCVSKHVWRPNPIANPANINLQRAKVGLQPIQEYINFMSNKCAQ